MPKTKPKTENSVLNVVLVWDMSGSMLNLRDSAIAGANDYIDELREDENVENMRFSVTVFNTRFERWYEDAEIHDLPRLGSRYLPSGFTALNDAVADAIFFLESRLKGSRKNERVLIVVLTDGRENSSQKYGGIEGTQELAKLISKKEETGKWTFVYLGAGTPDVVMDTAASYNIPAGNVAAYAATMDGVGQIFTRTARVTSASAAGMSATSTAMADAGYKAVDEQKSEEDQ